MQATERIHRVKNFHLAYVLALIVISLTFALTTQAANASDRTPAPASDRESESYSSDVVIEPDEVTVLNYGGGPTEINYVLIKGGPGNDDIDVDITNATSSTFDVRVSIDGRAPSLNYNHGEGSGNHTHTDVFDHDHYLCSKTAAYLTCRVTESYYGAGYEGPFDAAIYIDGGSSLSRDSDDDTINVTGTSDAVSELSYLYVEPDVGAVTGKDTVNVSLPSSVTDPILKAYVGPGDKADTLNLSGEAAGWYLNTKDRTKDTLNIDGITGPSSLTIDPIDVGLPLLHSTLGAVPKLPSIRGVSFE